MKAFVIKYRLDEINGGHIKMQESNNTSYENDEISLKELIQSIWDERKLISLITAVVVLISAVYTFFIATPVYEATSELMIQTPKDVATRFGTYTFPSENINDYIQYIYSNDVVDKVIKQNQMDITRASFKKMISVKFDPEDKTNLFSVVVSADDTELAKSINDDLINQYLKSIRITYKRNALENFITSYEMSIDNLEESIRQQESILEETKALMDTVKPIYTLQKALFADPKSAAVYADQLNLDLASLSEHVMTEEYVNGNYFSLESQYLEKKSTLINTKEALSQKKKFYEELLNERNLVNQASSENMPEKILNGRMDVLSQNISILSRAYEPERAISPRKALNLALGLVLGIMLGVFMGLFRAYWRQN